MAITAKEVGALRQATGAGMMDCKKALTESNGDFDAAVEILRKKGQKISAARADRDANQGKVFALANDDNSEAFMIELNCETDFVAMNDDFNNLGDSIINLAKSKNPATSEELNALPLNGNETVQEAIVNAMGRIGEKLQVGNYEKVSGEKVITYIHPGARVGVILGLNGVGSSDFAAIGKDVAMQIAAMRPVALDKDDVPADIAQKEFEIGKEMAKAEGKPEQILEKIATGRLNKFFAEQTLLNQAFVKDSSKTVRQYLKEFNPDMSVTGFKRIQLGES